MLLVCVYLFIQEVINVDAFIKEVNQRIKDIFIQNNGMIIERSSKCHLYKHITTTFCIQNYLNKCLPVNIRKAITKMRCSSHKLIIEKGRYLNLRQAYGCICSDQIHLQTTAAV